MKNIRTTHRIVIGGALVAVVAAGSSAVAFAANQQPASTVYKGCLTHATGTVYNIHLNPSTAPKCLSQDTQITWNQTGPAGAPGATGAPGAQGRKGDTGLQGPTGIAGPKGPTGIAGPKGDTGTVGPQGATGSAGLTGSPGATGTIGLTGPQGAKGDIGPQGPAGAAGSANVVTTGVRGAGLGDSVVLVDRDGMSLVVVCTATSATMEMYPSTSADPAMSAVVDSHEGGHVSGNSVSPTSPAQLEQAAAGVIDRGEFDAFNLASRTLAGSYFLYDSGTGCEAEASVSFS
jgi:collagen triple helix repeat protein